MYYFWNSVLFQTKLDSNQYSSLFIVTISSLWPPSALDATWWCPPPLVTALWWSRHMSQVSRVTLVALSDHFPVKPLLSLLGPSQPGRPERASSPLATSSHHGVISCQERRHIHSDGCPHSVLSAVDLLLPMTSYYCQRIGCHTTQGPSHNVSLTREMRQRLSCGSRFIALCYMMSPLWPPVTSPPCHAALTSLFDAAETHPRVSRIRCQVWPAASCQPHASDDGDHVCHSTHSGPGCGLALTELCRGPLLLSRCCL